MESTTGFQFCKKSDYCIAVCSFSFNPTRCNVRCHTAENREKDEEFVRLPSEISGLWGLMNCVPLTKYKGKNNRHGRRGRELTPSGESKAEFESSCTVASLAGWPKGRLGQGGGVWPSFLDQSLASAWSRRAAHSGSACLHLRAIALQTCPDDWRELARNWRFCD